MDDLRERNNGINIQQIGFNEKYDLDGKEEVALISKITLPFIGSYYFPVM